MTAIAGVRQNSKQAANVTAPKAKKASLPNQSHTRAGSDCDATSSVFNSTYRNMVNGMQGRLQQSPEIMARSQNSPVRRMPGGQRFSHYKDWIGSLQPTKYFSRNG